MSGGGQGSTSSPNPLAAGIGGQAAQQAQSPQWLKGLQLGTQMAAAGQQRPQQPMMQRPMMGGGGMPGGMPQQGVVPGSVPQAPMQPPMAGGGMGMPGGMPQQGGINPQLLQLLMRSRGQ